MKKVSRSSPSLSGKGMNDSSIEDFEDTLLDVVEIESNPPKHELSNRQLNASTPCLTESRPPSSIGRGSEWEDIWIYSMANSDSCLVSSSSGASPLTGTSSQGVSPDATNNNVFSFQSDPNKQPDRSLSSISDALQTEKEFIDYVMSFPISTSNIHRGCSADSKKNSTDASPKVGLDHLDNLCKLMEQLSDLKEANVKLKRRVQYLEDLKTLHEIHREMMGATTICNSAVSEDELQIKNQKNSKASPKPEGLEERCSDARKTEDSLRGGFMTGLYRSKTTTHVDSRADQKRDTGHRSRNETKGKARERSKSVGHPGHSKNKKRPSRWSKVKEVLGIEKTDANADKDEMDVTSVDYPKEEDSFEHSREEQQHRTEPKRKNHKDITGRPRSIATGINIIPKDDDFMSGCKKSPKTPWGKMKTMIQSRRDCRNHKSESSSSSSRGQVPQPKEGSDEHQVDHSQNGTRKNVRGRKSSFTLQDVSKRHPHDGYSTSTQYPYCERSPSRQTPHHREMDDDGRRKLANTCQNRKDAVDANSHHHSAFESVDKSSRHSSTDATTSKEVKRKFPIPLISEKTRAASSVSPSSTPPADAVIHKSLFTKSKVFEVKGTSSSAATQPSASATVTELLKELQENLSEDFNRKLEEWQKYRGEGSKPASLDIERKESFGRFRKSSKPDKKASTPDKKEKATSAEKNNAQKKDLNWLDKEIPKVEKEIIRLSKEKQKFEKRAFRLKHLKEAMTESQNGKEVLVKTAAGEFRFGGISNAFTKKLYEWETKKGVGPELSTIALLDESLKPRASDGEFPVIKDIETQSISPVTEQMLEKMTYQITKSNSEPDLSTLSTTHKESNRTLTPFRSKSGDTLLANSSMDSDLCHSNTEIRIGDDNQKSKIHSLIDRDDSYCSLLEENMFLLDQLKGKEEICTKLQGELYRLDEKCEKTNKAHQDELENYKQKLWEIHMSRPRDLQGSLQLISELKTRIEELEKCSDKLKCDREKLEESFKYHSEQQRGMADGLMSRIIEMQENRLPDIFNRTGCKRKWKKVLKCDAVSVTKIHELSTKLLQQARDMEESLAERTRQVCHLRWELLHRDMSAVLLQAALHRVTCQGPQAALLPTWNMKRIKFKELKAWSIDTTTRRQSENTIAEDWLQDRLKQLSLAPYNEWTTMDFDPNDLMDTVHELKKETFKMSTCTTECISDSVERKKTASCSAESEMADSDRNYDTGSAFNSRSSSLSSGPGGGLRGSHSDTRLYERSRSLSVHRNSSSSMSCVSGFDASESSSMHDSDRLVHHQFLRRGSFSWGRKQRNRWPSRENVSSSCSSHSSGLEEDNSGQYDHDKEEVAEYEDAIGRHIRYESLREADEENADYADVFTDNTEKQKHTGLRFVDMRPKPNGPTYTLLKSLISHPSYSRTITNCLPDDTSERNTDFRHYHHIDIDDSHLLTTKTNALEAAENVSSNYTSAESLESCNYVSHREKQLFIDIRNLAVSCESNSSLCVREEVREEISNHGSSPVVTTSTTSLASVSSFGNVTSTNQLKYKGTKGFGKTSRMEFKTYNDQNTGSCSKIDKTAMESDEK